MIITGRCRGNGAALADYLMDNKENAYANLVAISGTTNPSNLKLSLIEMSLTSELSGKSSRGIYHAQLSPRIGEALEMDIKQKVRMVEIFIEKMGMPSNTKWALVEQQKDGRLHFHLALQRYDFDTRTMWKHAGNYDKHKAASREMELEFDWKLTYQETNKLDRSVKNHVWDLWHKDGDTASFVKAMEKSGFEVTQGIDRRPYEFVDLHGTKFDLARQLDGVTQKDVAERLNPIRSELRETSIACHERREIAQKEKQLENQSDNLREMSDSQDLMVEMKKHYNQIHNKEDDSDEGEETGNYIINPINITFSPSLPQQKQEPEKNSDNSNEMSESQDLAVAMLKAKQKESERKVANDNNKDNSPLAKYRINKNDSPLAKYRGNKEDSPLAKYRTSRNDHDRDDEHLKERTRERGRDID
jgi:hypothetical protein